MGRTWVWLWVGLVGCTGADRDGDVSKDSDFPDPDPEDSSEVTPPETDLPTDSVDTPVPDTAGPEETDVPDTEESDAPDTDESDRPDTDESDLPDTDVPDTDVPDTDDSDLPDTDVPDSDLPDTDVPDTDDSDLRDTDVPDTDDSDVPDTDLPVDSADTHDTGRDSGDSTPPDDSTPEDTAPGDTVAPTDSSADTDTDTNTDTDTDTPDSGGDTADSDVPVDTDVPDTDVADSDDSADSGDSGGAPPEDTDDGRESNNPWRDTAADDTDTGDTDTDLVVDTMIGETGVAPTDSADSGAIGETGDSDPVDDSGWTMDTGDSGAPCDDDGWWPGADLNGDGTVDLPFRILVDVTGSTADLPGAPLFIDVALQTELRRLGERGALDDQSVRVVHQSCADGLPEVPSQFVDRLVGLPDKVEHISPTGDGRGTVAVVYDEDGDLRTRETLRAGQRARFGVYFTSITRSQGSIPAPTYVTDLAVSAGALVNGQVDARFDANQGGMLDSFAYRSSPNLTSQTDACCGNSMFFYQPNGWVDPMDGPGAVDVLARGPILGALRATGVRTATRGGVDVGAYAYEALYWLVAGRPELYHVTTQTALIDSVNEHIVDVTQGFRPWESRQVALGQAGGLVYEEDLAAGIGAVTGRNWGVAFGLAHRPTWVTDIANPLLRANGQPFVDYFAFQANDWVDAGLGTPATVPAGVTFFDHIGVLVWPYEGGFGAARPEMEAVMGFVDTTTRLPEAL